MKLEVFLNIPISGGDEIIKVSDFILKNGPSPASFIVYFQSFKTKNYNFYRDICKKLYPVSGTRIRTHELLDVSLLP